MLRRFLLAIFTCALPIALAIPAAQPKAGIDGGALDRNADPCTDFYQFACGGWIAHNPIPPDRASWGQLASIQERNNEKLHAILETAAPGRDPETKKIGDYYACAWTNRRSMRRAGCRSKAS